VIVYFSYLLLCNKLFQNIRIEIHFFITLGTRNFGSMIGSSLPNVLSTGVVGDGGCTFSLALVAHFCNPSYSGGRDQED
jgi:hypothetical protein